jgi:hypothetical protein
MRNEKKKIVPVSGVQETMAREIALACKDLGTLGAEPLKCALI